MRLTWRIGLLQKNKKKKKKSEKTPGLFKHEIVSTRSVWLISKPYLIQDENKVEKN